MSQNRNEWVMHIWGKKRDTLELNEVEKFHIDMLKFLKPQQKKFDKILINIALDDINDIALFDFLKKEVSNVLVNNNVEFKYCQNDSKQGEYVTFRPYVFDRIGEDVNVFYSHFKGYKSYVYVRRESFPTRVIDLSELFWSYIMYRYSLDSFNDVQNKLKDKCVYCWFLLKNKTDKVNLNYFKEYHRLLQLGDQRFKEYEADDLSKYSPGSFMWYNLKNIEKSLEDKPFIKSITTDYLNKYTDESGVNLCSHFCETYLLNYLKEDEIYSVKDYNKVLQELNSVLYTSIYPSKKFGREYLKDFDKYLIENNII